MRIEDSHIGIMNINKEESRASSGRIKYSSDDKAIDFKKVVDDYRSEYLTGMTEEEWNEFYDKCKQYLKENPINSKADVAAYTSFMKSLLQEYGFKGNINDMTSFLGIDESNLPSLENSNASVELKPSRTQIITEQDGTRYLIITTNSNQTMKIKIGSNTDSQNKSEQAVKAYERSFRLLEDKQVNLQ